MNIKTWMLVDDDPDEQQFFKDALREIDSNIWVHCAQDCDGAIKLLAEVKKKPELIFLDINMPGYTGKDCLVEIKKNADTRAIPVIIYTNSRYVKDKDDCMELGATMFLTKPSGFSVLKDELKQILQKEWKKEA